MNKLRFSINFLLIVIMLVFGPATFANNKTSNNFYTPSNISFHGDKDNKCQEGSGFGSGFLVNPTTVEGSGFMTMKNKTYSIKIKVTILSTTPQPDGRLILSTSHYIEYYPNKNAPKAIGTLTTQDVAVFTPTTNPGVYSLHTDATITNGTGIFKHDTGTLVFDGQANFNTGFIEAVINSYTCKD